MLRKSLPLFAIVAVTVAAGCAKKQEVREDQTAAQTQAQMQAPGEMMCPLQVPGVKVESGTADNGAAIVFTTSEKDQVNELRRRVTGMASMHNRVHGGAAPAPGAPPMMGAQARAENVENGAKIVLTPSNPANLEALRADVQQRVATMQQTGQCPMMKAGAAGQGCPHCAQGGGKPCPHAQAGQCPHAQGGQPCAHCAGAAPGTAGQGAAACPCAKNPAGCQCAQAPGGCKCGQQGAPQPKQP